MAAALCLRCDWSGETDDAGCPNCGAPLFRPPVAASTPAPAPGPASGPPASPPEERRPAARFLPGDDALTAAVGRRRSRSFVIPVVLALLVTGALWWFLRAHEVPAPAPDGGGAPVGVVVFVAGLPGRQHLWSLDLATGGLTGGPLISEPIVDLVDARGLSSPFDAEVSWLGLTLRVPGAGSQLAWLPSVSTAPIRLASGDLVTWQADGGAAAVVRTGPSTRPCGGSLRMDRVDTASGSAERTFGSRHFCGDVENVQEGVAATYFTWVRPGGTGVYYIGNGEPHLVLNGYEMLAMSPTADMLVRAPGGGPVSLFWRNAGAPRPYVLDGQPLEVDQTLAWNAARDGALVLGRVGERDGLFTIDTTPSGSPTPRYLGPAVPPVFATASDDGSFYVAAGGRLLRWRADGLEDVAFPVGSPPAGTPVPAGPLAWLPG